MKDKNNEPLKMASNKNNGQNLSKALMNMINQKDKRLMTPASINKVTKPNIPGLIS